MSPFANMAGMKVLADETRVAGLIEQLGQQVAHSVAAARGWALVGIRSRGDVIARRLAEVLEPDHIGTLDITLYRDDLSEVANQPVVRPTEIEFPIDGLDVVLVDDVLMTGRSVRAALDLLMDLGRPRRVWLAVLVDRGGRELPIAPDQVGLDLAGSTEPGPEQLVEVHVQPTDPCDQIIVRPRMPEDIPA